MARINGVFVVVVAVLISAMASGCYGAEKPRPFASLDNSLVVSDTVVPGTVLKAGVDQVSVTWGLGSNTNSTAAYKTVKVKLCYAPASQVDRPWRKTNLANIAKDKTCQFSMFGETPFTAANTTKTYTIKKEIPGATYFVRAYVYDSAGKEVAFGQTTNGTKTTHLFTIVGITGRTTSIDIASGVFSAFSILSLVYFFYAEKMKANKSLEN